MDKLDNGKLYIIGLPIGNLEDITFRAINILKSVDLILCEDTREFIKIATKYDITTKTSSFHDFNENQKSEYALKLLRDGKNLAIVSDRGTPTISDPGFILIQKYTEYLKFNISGIIIPIPGASASITAISACCFNSKFLFYGFAKKKNLESLKNITVPIVFFEAPHRVLEFLQDLKDIFGNRKIFIAREMTKMYEEFIYSDLNNIKINEIKGEFVIILDGNKSNNFLNIDKIQEICNMDINISNRDLCNLLTSVFGAEKSIIYDLILNFRKLTN